MGNLEFIIEDWISGGSEDRFHSATAASLKIVAGPGRTPVTKVEDMLARTIRDNIYVSVYPLVRWLLTDWWRLRWEPKEHSLASIGGDTPWPALEFFSDGEFIQLHQQAESEAYVAGIRYLQDFTLDIPVEDFERAVDDLAEKVRNRLKFFHCQDSDLEELWQELSEERSDQALTELCRWQALAGMDPGEASSPWIKRARALRDQVGSKALEEVLAAAPGLKGSLTIAGQTLEAMRISSIRVNLDWGEVVSFPTHAQEVPWQKGTRLAAEFRQYLGIGPGPVTDTWFKEHLGAELPLPTSRQPKETMKALSGGYSNGKGRTATGILVPSTRKANQRFYLARLIGCALMAPPEQHFLPATNKHTALQKYERAFAQEFLCPWEELDQFIRERGWDDEGLAEAAEHYQVSERLVTTTLVNKKKLDRDSLSEFFW